MLKADGLKMNDIQSRLTGIARMVVYTQDGSEKSIKSVTEGEMKKGIFDGYARKIFVSRTLKNKKEIVETNCQIGFWQTLTVINKKNEEEKILSAPYGKWT